MGLLVLALLAANPPLSPAERAHWAGPLIEATRVVQRALAKKKIRCAPTKPFDEAKPENWIQPESRDGLPASWVLLFDCQSPVGMRQLAIQLYDSAVPAPRKTVRSSGPGFFIRDVGDGYATLGVGDLLVFDQDKPLPEPARGPAKADPYSLSVTMITDEWLKLIPVDELLAVLARTPPPPGGPRLKPGPPPEPPKAPVAMPYKSVTAKVARVKVDEAWLNLVREPSPNQQAYFSTVAARGQEAVAKALLPTGLSCQLTSGTPSCASTSWDAQGFTPRCWTSHWTCDGEVSFMVELEGAAPAHVNPGITQTALASDVRLDSNQGFGRLVVGLDVPATRPVGGIPSLASISINGDTAQKLSAKLDLAPLRELLHSPPALPELVAVPAEGPVLNPSKRAARKDEVRQFVLEQYADEKVEQLVLFNHTMKAGFDAKATAFLAAAAPELDRSAIDDFSKLTAQSRPVKPFEFRVPVRLLSAAQQDALFRDRKNDGWAQFRKQYPNARGIITLSEVGLSRDGTIAVIAIDRQSDWLAGAGETWFLRKTATGWEKLCWVARWIS